MNKEENSNEEKKIEKNSIEVEKNSQRKENWLELARRKLKKVEDKKVITTPQSKRKKKIYKLENLTNSTSGKKKLQVGERKQNKIVEMKNIWEKRDTRLNIEVEKKNTRIAKDKNMLKGQNVRQIISKLDLKSDEVVVRKSESQKSKNNGSQSLIGRWICKRVENRLQTKSKETEFNDR